MSFGRGEEVKSEEKDPDVVEASKVVKQGKSNSNVLIVYYSLDIQQAPVGGLDNWKVDCPLFKHHHPLV
jgi:hypothetical protein